VEEKGIKTFVQKLRLTALVAKIYCDFLLSIPLLTPFLRVSRFLQKPHQLSPLCRWQIHQRRLYQRAINLTRCRHALEFL
jgi:hypothetical protein